MDVALVTLYLITILLNDHEEICNTTIFPCYPCWWPVLARVYLNFVLYAHTIFYLNTYFMNTGKKVFWLNITASINFSWRLVHLRRSRWTYQCAKLANALAARAVHRHSLPYKPTATICSLYIVHCLLRLLFYLVYKYQTWA